MKKYLNSLLIASPVILLAILTIGMAVLRTSLPEVTLRISGYDPRDLLSGHYIVYTIDWDDTDCKQFKDRQCPISEFRQHGIDGMWGNNHRFIFRKNTLPSWIGFSATAIPTTMFLKLCTVMPKASNRSPNDC